MIRVDCELSTDGISDLIAGVNISVISDRTIASQILQSGMDAEDVASFWRLHILAEVCFREMTGQLTHVGDLLNDQTLTVRVLKHPIRIVKTKESQPAQSKKRLFCPFIQYTAPPSVKAKRKRASPWQLAILRDAFGRCQFPSVEERRRLAGCVGMAERAVQIWFQNCRQMAKEKQA